MSSIDLSIGQTIDLTFYFNILENLIKFTYEAIPMIMVEQLPEAGGEVAEDVEAKLGAAGELRVEMVLVEENF